jgi:hypothetical protein
MKMKKNIFLAAIAAIAWGSTPVMAQDEEPKPPLGFFVTSTTHSGNLGGLAGADAECQRLAAVVGAGNRTWRAYLSTHGSRTEPAVNARDRIGNGPWYNANGVMVAGSVADLHGAEKGEMVNGRVRPEGTRNEHDILTGSDSHGRPFPPGLSARGDLTCNNWTSDSSEARAMIGHHDRMSGWNVSWNSSHGTAGCSLADFQSTGGAGRFYCFAAE